ncbi:MAG: oligopeptidase B, partial [Actinomycetales bacterium]|nr:oligopeptidase B [Actinomycetales bacterium]
MSVSPIAPRTPTTRLHHGDEFVDHYEWLRDKDDADVQAHLENENAYTESSTAHLADLRENIFQEIKGRTRETDMSVPGRKGDWWYYRRIEEGQNYSRLCRVPLTSPDDWNP